jgi:multidrug efflux pump subunit AcrA (membrane-fusion protein)
MSGDADIVTEVVEDALVVPETALRYRGSDVQVDVAAGDAAEARNVELGIVEGSRVQIVSGLTAGEQVTLQ